jgi:glutathione S-transferase
VPAGDDVQARARYEQAQNIEAFSFEPNAGGLNAERHAQRYFGREPSEFLIETYKKNLEKKLAGYDRILAKTRYLAGDEISLVDLFHIARGRQLPPTGVHFLEDAEKFPNVARYDLSLWVNDVNSRSTDRWWKDISNRLESSWLSIPGAQ